MDNISLSFYMANDDYLFLTVAKYFSQESVYYTVK